ncbi:DUF5329 domain-containing protein [Roseateles sp.]|uniref:DUF5329 domain-containing protein n=1 Tax=Roseateles sp. TaxID=1971397 RepID=UPI002F40BF97
MRASPLPILLATAFTAFTAFAAFVAVPTAAWADPLPPAAKAEVKALLDKLIASSCEFNRNGDWYSAAEAKSHLERKLKYLEDKNLVKTAGQFIDLAASKSSMSGKPYLVRCGGAAPVNGGNWLRLQLMGIQGVQATGLPPASASSATTPPPTSSSSPAR